MERSLDLLPRVVCVEHPGAVRDVDRAIVTLGGKDALRKTINSSGQVPLELRLRPEDVFSHPISSRATNTSHGILLKVRVKRAHLEAAGGDLRYAIAQHPTEYTYAPCAVIHTFVRFREIADFQYSTLHSPFASKIRDSLHAGNFDAIKDLNLFQDSAYSLSNLDLPPPPRFSRVNVPFEYAYRQNPAVTAVTDEATGTTRLVNKTALARLSSTVARWSDPSVPSSNDKSSPELPTLRNTPSNPRTLEIINILRNAFEERPIWTRRALEEEKLGEELRHMWASHVKFLVSYVAFTWKSGPWRTTYTKYGVDPRKDKTYAKFQTEYFRIVNNDEEMLYRELTSRRRRRKLVGGKAATKVQQIVKQDVITDENSAEVVEDIHIPQHIFDGIHLPGARSFQLCDITDPVLVSLINDAELRDKVDERDGWYQASTMAKIRRIIRFKLYSMTKGEPIRQIDIANILEEVDNGVMEKDGKETDSAENNIYESSDTLKDKVLSYALSQTDNEGSERLRGLVGIVRQDGDDPEVDDDEYEIFDDEDADENDNDEVQDL
ncbi:RNA polymerase III transcription factor IIIC subunit-domain-containing protein [Lipomyces oligophaga]|uniref:RNA polymerase III transcription factor IIIC subunit-domain-containing protein n=1 Tax=Lipomyces oligophaga TaxID=45792 RepID=UPI0034CD48FC